MPRPGSNSTTQTRTRPSLKAPRMWKVILHNDDYTTQEFVVGILRNVFRKDEAEAVRIMLDVHQKGKGVAGIYTHEIAETKVAQVKALSEREEFPLLCTLEVEE